jgi:hypothetical protein
MSATAFLCGSLFYWKDCNLQQLHSYATSISLFVVSVCLVRYCDSLLVDDFCELVD